MEAIKYILEIGELLTGRILKFDGLTMNIRTINVPNSSDNCGVCGTHPYIVSLSDNRR